jgi:hypothetical protein
LEGAYSASHLDSTQSFCLSLSPVSGCTAINDGMLSTSNYQCSACEPETHYLTGSPPVCTFRTVIANCKEYNPTLDECLTCESGFFLSATNTECTANPIGVPNCLMHDVSGIICKFCDSDHYLFGASDICMPLTTEEKKPNCESYDHSKRCIKCLAGYFWKNDFTCVETTAQDCLTFETESRCATCSNLYYLDLDTNASPRSCLAVNISNCRENKLDKCALCDPTFKPNADGTICTSVVNSKPNCSGYDYLENCIQCETPYIFNPELGTCLIEESMEKFLDPNCLHFRLSPKCNACKEGFYFNKEGKCTECGIENCHFCSREGKRCNLCRTGYYMDQSANCQKNSSVIFDSFEVTDDQRETHQIYNAIQYVFLIIASILMLKENPN